MLKRRMIRKMRVRNPWQIEFKRDVATTVFSGFQSAVQSSLSSFGIVLENDQTLRHLQVVFTDKRRFTRDIQVISGFFKFEVSKYLCKKFAGDWRAEMIVSPETPCKITYDKNKHQFVFSCYYGVWNQFDFALHDFLSLNLALMLLYIFISFLFLYRV